MALILNPLTHLQLLRHSRGFGIHSPFAYKFITEVLNQKNSYYAYRILPNSRQRLLYRILIYLRPTHVAVYGSHQLEEVARLALHKDVISKIHPTMVVMDGTYTNAEERTQTVEAVRKGANIIIFNYNSSFENKELIKTIQKTMGVGMTFDNLHNTFIAINDSKLPRQDFEVKF